MNQTLETFLRIFCSHQQDDWAKWLPFAQYALNSRPSMTTKIPPFEALIGVIPKGINLPTEQQSPWDRITELTLARKRAYEAILYSQMLITLDQTFKMYKEGEQVWLEAKNLKTMHPSHKLRARRYGPFKVTKALSHVTYQLELPHSWKIHNVFHASYLSHFKETIEQWINFLELQPDIVERQPEWKVEEIIGTRLFGKNKKRQYQVRWKGYSQAHDTWENEEDVFAEELVQRFKEKQRQTPSLTIRSARTRPVYNNMSQLVAGQFTTPRISSPVPKIGRAS